MCACNKRGSKSRLFLWKYAQFIKPVHIELEWVKKKTKKSDDEKIKRPIFKSKWSYTHTGTTKTNVMSLRSLSSHFYISDEIIFCTNTRARLEKSFFDVKTSTHCGFLYNNISRVFHELLRGRLKYYCVIIIKRQFMWDTRNFLQTYFS